MYVVAIYCNWKTLINFLKKNNINNEKEFHKVYKDIDFFYEILLNEANLPILKKPNSNSTGFRLPTVDEWKFDSRARDLNDYPWEGMEKSIDQKENEKGKLLKKYLTEPLRKTRSVMASIPNAFGIYGMIGNVREWICEKHEDTNVANIVGATWALGEDTFKYDFEGSFLPMVNTNLDVGFRWARSVSDENLKKIREAIKVKSKLKKEKEDKK